MSPQYVHLSGFEAVGQAPVNVNPPTITYSNPEGLPNNTASVSNVGTWLNNPTSFIYQWSFVDGTPTGNAPDAPSITVDNSIFNFPPSTSRGSAVEMSCFISAVNAFGQSPFVPSNSIIINFDTFDNYVLENPRVTFGSFQDPPARADMTLTFGGRVLGVGSGPNLVSINDTTGFLGSVGNSYTFRSDITDGPRFLRCVWSNGSKPVVTNSNGVNTPLDILTTNGMPPEYIRGGLPLVSSPPVIGGGTNVGDTITVLNTGSYNFNPNGPGGFSTSLDIGRIEWLSDNRPRQSANTYQPGVNDFYVIQPQDRGRKIQVSLAVGLQEDGVPYGGTTGVGFAPYNDVRSVGVSIPL